MNHCGRIMHLPIHRRERERGQIPKFCPLSPHEIGVGSADPTRIRCAPAPDVEGAANRKSFNVTAAAFGDRDTFGGKERPLCPLSPPSLHPSADEPTLLPPPLSKPQNSVYHQSHIKQGGNTNNLLSKVTQLRKKDSAIIAKLCY